MGEAPEADAGQVETPAGGAEHRTGAHATLASRLDNSLEAQGKRVGDLEAEQRSQGRVCEERHKARTSTVDIAPGQAGI